MDTILLEQRIDPRTYVEELLQVRCEGRQLVVGFPELQDHEGRHRGHLGVLLRHT